MALYARRERLERYSAALGAHLSRLPLSANGWTLLGVGLGLAAAAALAAGSLGLGGVLYLLGGLCDLADGAVARQRGAASRLGAYLDTLADRVTEAAALFGLLFVALPPLGLSAHHWVFLYLFASQMVTYAKAAAKEKGLVQGELSGGLIERAERVIILGAGLLLGSRRPLVLVWVLALLTVLSLVSLIQRVRLAVTQGRQGGR